MTAKDPRLFRLLLHTPQEGAWNMAVDEALLESVEGERSLPAIRLYGFSPPTLSLGRFQFLDGAEGDDGFQKLHDRLQRDRIDLVRRPTGGQAVLHDDELTYAVLLGRRHLEPFGKRQAYRFVARFLLQGLLELGLQGNINEARRGDPLTPDCFASTGEYEIQSLSAKKLIGSAQLTTRKGCLQHGSIPISVLYRRITDYLGGGQETGQPKRASCLGEQLGRPLSFEDVQGAFQRAARTLYEVREDELTVKERSRAGELADAKYRSREWTALARV